jgi:hypothetical protein
VDLNTFITAVFCLTDDWLKGKKLTQRGSRPELADSEVLTIEVVGEFLGIDTEEGPLRALSPLLRRVVPGSQRSPPHHLLPPSGEPLWVVKEMLWKHLLNQVRFDPEVSLIDSFPVPTCHFARAYRCVQGWPGNRPSATTR